MDLLARSMQKVFAEQVILAQHPWLSLERDESGRWWLHIDRVPTVAEYRAVRGKAVGAIPRFWVSIPLHRNGRALRRLAEWAGLQRVIGSRSTYYSPL